MADRPPSEHPSERAPTSDAPGLWDPWLDAGIPRPARRRRVPRTGRVRVSPWRIVQVGSLVAWVVALLIAPPGTYYVGDVTFSRDGKTLAAAVDGYYSPTLRYGWKAYGVVMLWDVRTGVQRGRLPGSAWLSSLAFSPDGTTLAMAGESPVIELWDPARGTKAGQLIGHQGRVSSVTFAPVGAMLASAGGDGTVRLWDVATRQTQRVLAVSQSGADRPQFTPDGREIVSSDRRGVRFWNVSDGRVVKEIKQNRLGFLGFTDDIQNYLLVQHRGQHGEGSSVLDGSTMSTRYPGWKWGATHKLLSPDSRIVVTADPYTHLLELLDVATGEPIHVLHSLPGQYVHLAFSPDGTMLAVGDNRGTVRVWDVASGEILREFSTWDMARRWGPTIGLLSLWAVATWRRRLNRRLQALGGT